MKKTFKCFVFFNVTSLLESRNVELAGNKATGEIHAGVVCLADAKCTSLGLGWILNKENK